jgi:hypothetical protein
MRIVIAVTAIVGFVMLVGGCASDFSKLDNDFGTSVKLSKANQILNPDAEKNVDVVQGMDGTAAEKVLEKYHEGFEKPTEGPTYTFKVGGAK